MRSKLQPIAVSEALVDLTGVDLTGVILMGVEVLG
jgi:hypothetical protein